MSTNITDVRAVSMGPSKVKTTVELAGTPVAPGVGETELMEVWAKEGKARLVSRQVHARAVRRFTGRER